MPTAADLSNLGENVVCVAQICHIININCHIRYVLAASQKF